MAWFERKSGQVNDLTGKVEHPPTGRKGQGSIGNREARGGVGELAVYPDRRKGQGLIAKNKAHGGVGKLPARIDNKKGR